MLSVCYVYITHALAYNLIFYIRAIYPVIIVKMETSFVII